MSQSDRAFDSGLVYHQHVFETRLATAFDLLRAASLANDVADAEYIRAAEASTRSERAMYLRAADKARATRNGHEMTAEFAAEITAIGDLVLGGDR